MLSGLVNGVGPISHGEYKMVTADDTAGTTAIDTGLTSIETIIVTIRRANVTVTGDAVISYSAGVLTIADGSTYALTANDVASYIAVGK